MEVKDFRTEVVDKSFEVPVVVDFWAPWCGPCRALGPIIESLAEEANGHWILAKLNTDENPEIAEALQIMSIPAVKMIYQGKIIGEFVGALPKPQIQQWLAKHLPAMNEVVPGADEAVEEDTNPDAPAKLPALDEVIPHITQVPDPEFVMYLEDYLIQHPEDDRAKSILASHLVFSNPDQAEELTSHIKEGNPQFDLVHDVRTLSSFYITEFDESKAGTLLNEARNDLDHGWHEQAMEKLIESMHINKSYKEEIARKTGIALFHIYGKNHPVTRSQRKYFDMAVY